MALASLATLGDLADRNIVFPDDPVAETVLSAVSAAIRDAAGCTISSTTSTIRLVAPNEQWLDLPSGPVTAVSSVAINTDAALVAGTDYVQVADTLWRSCGWLTRSTSPLYAPTMVTVTYTHGLAVVPADIVDLVCSFASMSLSQIVRNNYGVQSSVQAEHAGPFSVVYDHPTGALSGARNPSPVSIPEGTRAMLRARFGTSVAVVSQR